VAARPDCGALVTFCGTVSPIDTVGTGQAATCWVAQEQMFFYASNAAAGSASVSQHSDSPSGELGQVGQTGTDLARLTPQRPSTANADVLSASSRSTTCRVPPT